MVRLNVNINDDTQSALKELSERRGMSVTEVVRRSVSLYALLEPYLDNQDVEVRLVKAPEPMDGPLG